MSPPVTIRLAVAALALIGTGPVIAQPHADLVFRGGAIYTVDAQRSWASAVAIRAGRIIYVGDDRTVAEHIGNRTRVIELSGRMLLPGFHDSHMHPMSGGTRFTRCQLAGLRWPDEVYKAIESCAATWTAKGWFLGVGLSPAAFYGSGPSRALLDELVADRPAYVTNEDGHLAWANSAVLAIAGIDARTPDPVKGTIERDPASGEPSGTLRGGAIGLVWSLIPTPSAGQYRAALRTSLAMANRFGITSLNDASASAAMLEAYQQADAAGELTVRVQASQRIDRAVGPEQVDTFIRRRDRSVGKRFRADAAKFFVDGDIVHRTAAMLQPYLGSTDDRGETYIDATALDAIVLRLDAEDFQIHMHVVGDRAARIGLDAIEAAIARNGARDRRHQLAHLKLLHSLDIPRFKRLGVAADFQTLWAYFNADVEQEQRALGPERANRLLPVASVFKSRALVVAGSDWPSESMNPLHSIQIAMTRRPPNAGKSAWLASERASLADMLAAYTINGAWLARRERLSGSIEVGKVADLIVLESNLFELQPMELRSVRVLLTLLDGEPVYRDSGLVWSD